MQVSEETKRKWDEEVAKKVDCTIDLPVKYHPQSSRLLTCILACRFT
jgi:hypothetical protein